MRKALIVAGLQFRLVYSNKATFFVLLAMPLLFTTIFGLLMSGSGSGGGPRRFPVAVADEDQSVASRLLVETLQVHGLLQVQEATRPEVTKLFADKKLAAAVVIPAGYEQALRAGSGPQVELLSAPGGNLAVAVSPIVQREAMRVASDFHIALMEGEPADEAHLRQAYARVGADREQLGITLSREQAQRAQASQRREHSSLTQASLGFTVMFVMMLTFMQGGVILQERQNGTWGRLLTTPSDRTSLLTGYLLSFFLIGMAQFGLLVGATRLFFGVQWGAIGPLFALAGAFVLCSAGLGLFVAGIVRTAEQQRNIATIVVVASSMLGGVYWPLEFVGETMQRIGYLTPQAWAMQGFTEIMLRGGSFGALLWPMTVLLSLTVIFMTAGVLRVRYE